MISTNLVIIALVAYLLGSIPFGYILVKLFLKQDIRQTGSGNIGATNVARSGKKGLAIATLLLDVGKGFAATVFAFGFAFKFSPWKELAAEVSAGLFLAAFMAVLGHCFPVWLRFQGGKGVATAVGAYVFIYEHGVAAALAAFVIAFAATRYVSLSSIVAALVFPCAAYLFDPSMGWGVAALFPTSLLIILKHHANIRRLIAGTEPKFGAKAIVTTDPIQTEKNA